MAEIAGEWLPGPLTAKWAHIALPCVYRITHGESGKSYVGSTIDLSKRMKRHLRELNAGIHHNALLQRAWDKYGEKSFNLRALSIHEDVAEARLAEQDILDREMPLGMLYNISATASGGDLISQHPRRIGIITQAAESNRLRWHSMSPQAREEISQAFTGENNPMYGVKHSDEARALMAKNHSHHSKGGHYERTPEHRELLSILASDRTGELNPFHGRSHSSENRKKMGEKNIGRTPVNATPLAIDGVEYSSLHAASAALSTPVTTIRHRCLSSNPRFGNYQLLGDEQ